MLAPPIVKRKNLPAVIHALAAYFALYRERLARCKTGLRVHQLMLWLRCRRDKEFNTNIHKLQTAIAFFLREPLKLTRQTLIANAVFLAQVEQRRNALQSVHKLGQYKRRIDCAQEQNFSKLTAGDSRSRIVACYHFGDFIYSLNYLMCLERPGRNRILYSQHAHSSAYLSNMQRAFDGRTMARDCQLTQDQINATDLFRELRRGNCTLAMFCDLPGDSGEVVKVNFLGRKARFPKGLALLAITSRTPVLPVIACDEQERNRLRIFNLIEPSMRLDEDLDVACVRITQQLVDILAELIAEHPQQWRYLSKLPRYFSVEDFAH